MKIKKGQILALTSGEYSDYCLIDHVLVLKDFDTNETADAFSPPDIDNYDFDKIGKYISWLISSGYIEPLKEHTVIEFYVGSYDRLYKDK